MELSGPLNISLNVLNIFKSAHHSLACSVHSSILGKYKNCMFMIKKILQNAVVIHLQKTPNLVSNYLGEREREHFNEFQTLILEWAY